VAAVSQGHLRISLVAFRRARSSWLKTVSILRKCASWSLAQSVASPDWPHATCGGSPEHDGHRLIVRRAGPLIAAELTVPERVLPFLPLDLEKTEIGGWDQATLLMGYGDLDGSIPLFLIAFFAVSDARKAISHGPRKGLWVTRPGPRRPSSAQLSLPPKMPPSEMRLD
jgi:hypothetical protein